MAAVSLATACVMHANAFVEEGCTPNPGQHVFETKCALCHAIDKTKGTIVGPNLFGVFGWPIGKLPAFSSSKALAESPEKWGEKERDLFLKAPSAHKPGTTMPFTRIKNDAERASTICYLKQPR
jgi:cytochrome c